MSEHDTPKKDATDFEAAQAIVNILRNRDKGEQGRILRWVSESLQLAPAPVRSPAAPTPSALSSEAVPEARTTDIRSFVAEKQPKSDVQFAAVAAYFYRFEASEPERKSAIGASDLQAAARYLDRAEQRGTFRVNAVGENLVAMALPGGTDETAGNRTRGKTRKAKAPRKGKNTVKHGRSSKHK
jgi:hypothetical protein